MALPMDFMNDRQTLEDRRKERYAVSKDRIVPNVIAKEEKRQSKEAKGKAFRNAVWARDKSICRATRKKLERSGTNPHLVGEVDHVIDRSLAPERIYDVSNGILISKYLNRLKKVACVLAPEFRMFEITGPDDRGQPQKFTWREKDGTIKKERIN